MISQEEIKALKEILLENKDSEIKIARSFLEDIVEYFENQPKIGEWIPCSERLPEEGQRVLATHEGGLEPNRQVIEHYFHDGQFLNNWHMDADFKSPTFGQRYMGDVIAWQPLPEPHKP